VVRRWLRRHLPLSTGRPGLLRVTPTGRGVRPRCLGPAGLAPGRPRPSSRSPSPVGVHHTRSSSVDCAAPYPACRWPCQEAADLRGCL